jgi:hypothetical protein
MTSFLNDRRNGELAHGLAQSCGSFFNRLFQFAWKANIDPGISSGSCHNFLSQR